MRECKQKSRIGKVHYFVIAILGARKLQNSCDNLFDVLPATMGWHCVIFQLYWLFKFCSIICHQCSLRKYKKEKLELDRTKIENVKKLKSTMATLTDECEETINYCCYFLILHISCKESSYTALQWILNIKKMCTS